MGDPCKTRRFDGLSHGAESHYIHQPTIVLASSRRGSHSQVSLRTPTLSPGLLLAPRGRKLASLTLRGYGRSGAHSKSELGYGVPVLGMGALLAFAISSKAQRPSHMLRVGYVGIQPREAPMYTAFIRKMAELGYIEGRNFSFEFV